MSRTLGRLLSSAVGLLLLAMPANATAVRQEATTPPQVDHQVDVQQQLMNRIDSLIPIHAEARRIADEAARLRDEAHRRNSAVDVDTFSVGGLTVIALPDQLDVARELFETAWADYTSFEGSPALQDYVVTFQWAAQFQPIYLLDSPKNRRVEHRRWRSREYVLRAVRRSIGSILPSDLTETRIGQEWVSSALGPPDDLTMTYRELVTIPSKVSRACLAGDGKACWTALSLDVEGEDLTAWYSDEELVEFVRRRVLNYSIRYAANEEFAPCTIQQLVEACKELIGDRRWMRGWIAPLGGEARLAMLWFAVEAGGEGAWARLIEDAEASPSEALQAASGLTPEELGMLWRERVMEHRPAVYAGSIPVSWGALFWIAMFVALATRSTRWRLG